MSSRTPTHRERRLLLLGALAASGALTGLLWSPTEPGRLSVALAVAEAAILAIVVPLSASRARAHTEWIVPALCIVAFPLCLAIAGWHAPERMVWVQGLLLCWAALLAGVVSCLRRVGVGKPTTQLLGMLLAFAMLGTPFYANWFVEMSEEATARDVIVGTALWANPWLIATGTLLESDPIRTKRLYALSTMHLYGFRYPASGSPAVAARGAIVVGWYGGAALLLHAASFALKRRGRKADTAA